jgi:hypothetical protein
MRLRAQNARRAGFVVPTNNALGLMWKRPRLLLFWPFTTPDLHLLFFFSGKLKRRDVSRIAPSIDSDGKTSEQRHRHG